VVASGLIRKSCADWSEEEDAFLPDIFCSG